VIDIPILGDIAQNVPKYIMRTVNIQLERCDDGLHNDLGSSPGSHTETVHDVRVITVIIKTDEQVRIVTN
jgi:hypothetical protein